MSHAWKITAALSGTLLLSALVAPRLAAHTSWSTWGSPSYLSSLPTPTAPLDPSDDEAWGDLGDSLLARGQVDEARAAYVQACRLDPADSEWTDRIHELMGPADLIRVLEEIAAAHPGDDELLGNLADACRATGQTDRAIELYTRAMRLDPSDTEWHTALAELGQLEVVASLTQNLVDTSMDDEVIGDQADMHFAAGQVDQACELYLRAHDLDPGDDEWIQALASRCGDAQAALLASFDSSEPLTPALAMARAGQPQQALTLGRAALVSNPEDHALRLLVAHLEGRTHASLLEELTNQYPANDEILGDLADHYLDQGRISEALALYQRARILDPGDEEWTRKVSLAMVMSQQG